MTSGPSDKSRGVALALAILLGPFGAHRFYAGKIGTGILMAATLGGMGVWYLYDCILVGAGGFKDIEGRRITKWDPDEPDFNREMLPQEVFDELHALRQEVSELAERVDFTERLLANPDRERQPGTR